MTAAQPGLDLATMQTLRDAALVAGDLASMLGAEVGAHRLLSAQDEHALATALHDPHATPQQRDAARERFVNANIRLVAKIAKSYAMRQNPDDGDIIGAEFADLVGEGLLGLLKAVDTFDPTRGYKFSTHATWWIRQAISRGISEKAEAIRIPEYMRVRQRQLLRLRDALDAEAATHDAAPLADEALVDALAARSGLDAEEVEEALYLLRVVRARPVSLDRETLPGDDESRTLLEGFSDAAAEEALDAVEQAMDARLTPDSPVALIEALWRRRKANRRPLRVLLRRRVEGVSLATIGADLGVTHERARQLEVRAMELVHQERARVRREMARAQARRTGQPQRLRQQDHRQDHRQEQQKGGAA